MKSRNQKRSTDRTNINKKGPKIIPSSSEDDNIPVINPNGGDESLFTLSDSIEEEIKDNNFNPTLLNKNEKENNKIVEVDVSPFEITDEKQPIPINLLPKIIERKLLFIRNKTLLRFSAPSFEVFENDRFLYKSELRDTSIGTCYIINSGFRIDRYSKNFIGLLKKHELGKRFTYFTPAGEKYAPNNCESMGVCFWDNKNPNYRKLLMVIPPLDIPYFPNNKEGNLSRIAKSGNIPEGFEFYNSNTTVEFEGYLKSIKNIQILSSDLRIIFSFIKFSENNFLITFQSPFTASLAFALSIAISIANP